MNKKKTLLKKWKASLVSEYNGTEIIAAYILAGRKKINFPMLTFDYKTKSGNINSLQSEFMQKYSRGSLIEQFDQFHWGESENKRKMKFEDWIQYAIETVGRYLSFYA
jgi:hypothetical protein